ncbi:MAG TPA: glycosyltransferase [Verrucomicrobiae bacterium]|nr:glycosyltransferase [Verrucomicrobiae bacterium]
MRHLHFTQSLEPLEGGGLGRAALDLHLQLLQDGFVSRLITTRSPSFDRAWPETFQYPRTGPQKAFFARALERDSHSAVAGADVVHGHGFYVYTNWVIGGRACSKHKPLIYHPQGMLEPWILRRSRWKKRVVGLLFERRNMRACRLWRALTFKEADQIRHQGFSAPIVVAPNGVLLADYDAELPVRAASRLTLSDRARERKRLVFMARLHPKKGLDLLIPAWAKLKDRHAGWELLIAGPDENGYCATVVKMIQELGVSSCTTLVGPVTGASKLELLKSADLFVLPSHSEGFPVSVLEAMACRVPVIGTDACNFAELETEGGGWLCEANPDSVQKALEAALHSSATERKSRGETARKLVEQRYTWPAISATIRAACESHCA